jgi:hypothetical protein
MLANGQAFIGFYRRLRPSANFVNGFPLIDLSQPKIGRDGVSSVPLLVELPSFGRKIHKPMLGLVFKKILANVSIPKRAVSIKGGEGSGPGLEASLHIVQNQMKFLLAEVSQAKLLRGSNWGMNANPRILQLSDLETIIKLERSRLETSASPEAEPDMSEWHAPWRTEALNHYLPLGWSFGFFQGEQIVAYFLAQPQLFMRSMTQSLWLEHLSFSTKEQASALLEIAYRLCREKHFQTLLLPKSDWTQHLPLSLQAAEWEKPYLEVKTARF